MASTTTHAPTTTHDRGMLRPGAVLDDGAVVVDVGLTAYYVRRAGFRGGEGCEWRSFDMVHGRPAPASPLVRLG